MERLKAYHGARRARIERETLRLIVALFGMGAAIGLWPMPGLEGALRGFEHQEQLASLWSVVVFLLSWMILTGLYLRAAALTLMALVLVAASLATGPGLIEFALVGALAMIAGVVGRKQVQPPARDGRIRLTRIKTPAPRRAPCTTRGHPFQQSPDELSCLFDQIAESH